VIAGHRDSHFRNLRQLRRDDLLMLETGGDVHVYRVIDQTIVVPTDTSVLDPTPRPTLTLITCYPFFFVGHAPKRYILRAELVS
jgi:sortase A